jgi:hypothetical protein
VYLRRHFTERYREKRVKAFGAKLNANHVHDRRLWLNEVRVQARRRENALGQQRGRRLPVVSVWAFQVDGHHGFAVRKHLKHRRRTQWKSGSKIEKSFYVSQQQRVLRWLLHEELHEENALGSRGLIH